MKNQIVITANETYPWSFVIQTLRNSLPGHGAN